MLYQLQLFRTWYKLFSKTSKVLPETIFKVLMDRSEFELVEDFFSDNQWRKFLLWYHIFYKITKLRFDAVTHVTISPLVSAFFLQNI